jgi:hypothetical protein
MKPKAKIIISRYNEPWEWVKDYTDNFLIYNKGIPLGGKNVVNTENIGGNQRDIFKFFVENYENLPELMAFIQAYPFDHCRKEVFDKLIYSEHFTALEFYGSLPANYYENRDENGGFMERNNSWYVSAHNKTYKQSCKYSSFDEFMGKYFEDYSPLEWIRFAPGSQYIVEKKQALHYPKGFWESLMEELNAYNTTEAHIIERSLYYILEGVYRARYFK